MLLIRAGLFIFAFVSVVTLGQAQPGGEVESIGFSNTFRPDAWTPMLVRLRPDSSDNRKYSIRVRQTDLDDDFVVYETPTFTLQGNEEGRGVREERFWVYFLPTPNKGGLPDRFDADRGTLKDLQQRLVVQLVDEKGTPVANLPLTSTITSADPSRDGGGFSTVKSRRFILVVTDGASVNSALSWNAVGGGGRSVTGNLEDTIVAQVQPRELPENVLGFDAVDTVVWMNADANALVGGTRSRTLEALDHWVRAGGRLVVCQGPDTQRVQPLASLLPIETTGEQGGWSIPMIDTTDLTPLRELALRGEPWSRSPELKRRAEQDWNRPLAAPIKFAVVRPRGGSVVDLWMKPRLATTQPTDATPLPRSPFLIRQTVGLGTVTWVATDLGNRMLTSGARPGWPAIWDAVLGLYGNSTVDVNDLTLPVDTAGGIDTGVKKTKSPDVSRAEALRNKFSAAPASNLGESIRPFTDLNSKSSKFVAVALLFFVVYWVVAGPGVFIYLVAKKQTSQSWFIFGLISIAATVLTVVVVQIAVSGSPQVSHFSVVRYAPGAPTDVMSNFGLYIPRDGPQEITLGPPTSGAVGYVAPLSEHPDYARSAVGFVDHLQYAVPLPEAATAHTINVPFRRTLKRLEARWAGDTGHTGIIGQVRAVDGKSLLEGKLANSTGQDLKHVYIVFTQRTGGTSTDWMLYLPTWRDNTSLNLADEMNSAALLSPDGPAQPGRGSKVKAPVTRGQSWTQYWRPMLRIRGGLAQDNALTDLMNASGPPNSFVMMSLFSLLEPLANQDQNLDRAEILRRGGRHFDLASVVTAGDIVVLAQAEKPLPLPLPIEVNGRTPAGEGMVFFQAVVPLQRDNEFEEPVPADETPRARNQGTGP